MNHPRIQIPTIILLVGWTWSFGDPGKNWQGAPLTILSGQVVEVSPEENASQIRMEIRNPENGNWELVNTGYLPKSSKGKLYFKIPQKVDQSLIENICCLFTVILSSYLRRFSSKTLIDFGNLLMPSKPFFSASFKE